MLFFFEVKIGFVGGPTNILSTCAVEDAQTNHSQVESSFKNLSRKMKQSIPGDEASEIKEKGSLIKSVKSHSRKLAFSVKDQRRARYLVR